MDNDFFMEGETIAQYTASLSASREKFLQHKQEVELDDAQLARLQAMPDDLNVLVIAEEWSGDVLYYLPVLLKMAETAGWNVRIFRRDRHPDLILPYRKENLYHSIPVVVFFDQDFNEIARWIERPAAATKVIDDESLKLRRRLREENREAWREAAIAEILNLIPTPESPEAQN